MSSAFDGPTQRFLEKLRANPIDKYGAPIVCKACTDKLGYGHAEKCQSESACPFRQQTQHLKHEQ